MATGMVLRLIGASRLLNRLEMNRIFNTSRAARDLPEVTFSDVTTTALAAGHNIGLRVETSVVRRYQVPRSCDDEGMAFIGMLLEALYDALAERIPAKRVSHGEWLTTYLEVEAQHRQRQNPEALHLRVLLGPCNTDNPEILICRAASPEDECESPF